jgi:hypothetical protein
MKHLAKFSSLSLLTTLAISLLLTACGTTQNQRISQNEQAFNNYTPAERKMIRTGQIAIGFDQDMVRMALGDPSRETTINSAAGKQIAWEYHKIKPNIGIGLSGGINTRGSGLGIGTGVNMNPNNTKLLKRVIFDRHTGKVSQIETYQ